MNNFLTMLLYDDYISNYQITDNNGSLIWNIEQEKNNTILNIELPGVDKDDCNITYNQDVLKVEYKKKDKTKSKEFYFKNVDFEKITAKLDKGILTIYLPDKRDKQIKKIKIE